MRDLSNRRGLMAVVRAMYVLLARMSVIMAVVVAVVMIVVI